MAVVGEEPVLLDGGPAPRRWPQSRASWSPAACRTSTPTTASSTCSSASTLTQPKTSTGSPAAVEAPRRRQPATLGLTQPRLLSKNAAEPPLTVRPSIRALARVRSICALLSMPGSGGQRSAAAGEGKLVFSSNPTAARRPDRQSDGAAGVSMVDQQAPRPGVARDCRGDWKLCRQNAAQQTDSKAAHRHSTPSPFSLRENVTKGVTF